MTSADSERERGERRVHRVLREALDELVQHVRVVRRTLPTMTPDQIAYAQDRLEWLADEVWRLALHEQDGDL